MNAIVIGAGLSGLAAANRLVRGGFTVTLIEARNRVGGRVLSLRADDSAVELGAEWVGNTGVLHTLLNESGTTVTEMEGRYLRRTADGYKNAWDPEENAQPVLARATSLAGPDRSLRTALTELGITDAEARPALSYVEGFHAADPNDVGIRWLGEVEANQSAAESSFRCVEGLDRAIAALGKSSGAACDVRLETVARAVRWGPNGAEVDVESARESGTLRSRAAIITIPLALYDDLAIDPPLAERRQAASLLRTGDVAKVVLHMRHKFWESNPALTDMAFLFSADAEFPTIWTGSGTTPVLNVWAGGPRAARLCALPDDEIVSRAVGSVAHAARVDRSIVENSLVRGYFHNWRRDPFSRGAYTYVGVGGSTSHATLARSAGDTLFFAGETTMGGGYNATMEGAVRSGFRAADEVVARIR